MNSIAKKILKFAFQRKAKKGQLSRLIVVEVMGHLNQHWKTKCSIIITKELTGQITLPEKTKQNVMNIKEITGNNVCLEKRAKCNEYQ